MKKIISLFQRNYDGDRLVRDEVVPGAEWVIQGEGVATQKLDGTCCMIRGGILYKRYDAKKGKTPPVGFIPAQPPDEISGHWPGWLRIGEGPEDKYFREAWDTFVKEISGDSIDPRFDGTYELCGPKIQANPEGLSRHLLFRHGQNPVDEVPRNFDDLREFFQTQDIEGIVWHHPDGRMVKIKARDFGIKRGRS